MGSTLRALVVLVAMTALALTGCGEDEPAADEGASGEADSGPPEPCELADASDVEAAFGDEVADGGGGTGTHTENDVAWDSNNCNWVQAEVLDVRLGLTTADDFEGGELLCPELSRLGTPATPVTDLEEDAFWVGDELDEVEGTLRICTDEVLVDLDSSAAVGSRDVDTLRDQTVALGQVVIDNLG